LALVFGFKEDYIFFFLSYRVIIIIIIYGGCMNKDCMNNKNKGFTLIELLAVVMVLGIIALISVPSVSGLLAKSKKDALLTTANNLVSTAKNYYLNKMLLDDELNQAVSINVTDPANMSLLEFDGKLPSGGYILIDSNGDIGIAVSQGDYCATKDVYSSEVTVTENVSDCKVTSLEQLDEINSSCFLLDDDKDTIIGYNYDNPVCGVNVVIPAEIGGKAITAIGDGAFVKNHDHVFAGYYDGEIEDIIENADIYKSTFNYDPDYIFVTSGVPDSIFKYCYNEDDDEFIKPLDYKIHSGDGFYACYVDDAVWDYESHPELNSVDFSYATNLKSIGMGAFYDGWLSSINFGSNSNIEHIGAGAFIWNNIVGTVDMSGLTKLTEIPSYVFDNNNIENIILPSNITSIGVNTFSGNELTSVVIPNSVTSLGRWAFQDNGLTNVTIPATVTSIGYCAFRYNNWNSVTIEANAENNKYRFNDNWVDIGWPSGLMTVEPEATVDYALTTSTNLFPYLKGHYVVNVQTSGTYKLEVWGAEGSGIRLSGNTSSGRGGTGGYSSGIINLTSGTTLYIYTGGTGKSSSQGTGTGGFNGGGSGYSSSIWEPGNGGGGATDIRIGGTSLYQRVIVAGGGGGGGEDEGDVFGYGGGTTGVGYSSYDATQVLAGGGGAFGLGGTTNKGDGGGGGGGWYGGGTLSSPDISTDTQGGGGGSGWIYTASTFATWQAGKPTDAANWLLNSSYYLTSAVTTDGSSSVPTYDGSSTMTGNTGNGYAKITYIG
jgi:prepilin-type N-terminal cleavage/methylation domain-containing protein